MNKIIKVRCPQCQKEFEYYSSQFRPFCGEQCRLIDLGQWLNGSYAVPAVKITEEEQAELRKVTEGSDEDQ